jgi:hypothetical protein
MMKNALPIHLVVRPSGIWNSRAPLHNYILERKKLSRTTSVLTLATYELRRQAKQASATKPVDRLLKGVVGVEAVASQAWTDYRRSNGKRPDGFTPKPTAQDLIDDSFEALTSIREMATVRLSALFEAFSQCWALNYLLTLLENGEGWSKSERHLAMKFHPLIGKGHVPSWPEIVSHLPFLRGELSKIPNMFTNPGTGEAVNEPLTPEENAFNTIGFWRSHRNLSVHTSRLTTRKFHKKYKNFFKAISRHLAHSPEFKPGRPLPFHDDFFSAMASAQYRAVLWMNERLIVISNSRRGHPEAPGELTTQFFETPPPTPPLLLPSDHNDSFRWINDEQFRIDTCAQCGWEYDA